MTARPTSMHPHVATCTTPGCSTCDSPEGLSYAGGEFFDVTGTPAGFCSGCEHAPCVAGWKGVCGLRPRFIVARGVREEIFALLDQVDFPNPLWMPLRMAVYGLFDAARGQGVQDSDDALAALAILRAQLRELIS